MRGVLDMAYTSLMSDGIYTVPCVIKSGDATVVEFVVDTGAAGTVVARGRLSGLDIVPTGRKRGFKTASQEIIYLSEVHISQFTIHSINLGACDICIGDISLLGMDLLQKVTFVQKANTRELVIREANDTSTKSNETLIKKFCNDNHVDINYIMRVLPSNWTTLSHSDLLRELSTKYDKSTIGHSIEDAIKSMYPSK